MRVRNKLRQFQNKILILFCRDPTNVLQNIKCQFSYQIIEFSKSLNINFSTLPCFFKEYHSVKIQEKKLS